MSQEKVAGILGVPEGTIARWEWEVKKDISILRVKDAYNPPDLRIKVPKKEQQKITERVTAGESQSQIAADYKITQPRVSQIVKQKKAGKASILLLAPGKFDVIYADPPWQYEFSETEARSIEAHYDTLSLEGICNYKDGNGTPVQEKVAGILGVPEGTIAWWDAEVKKDISILGAKDAYNPPDLRIKVPKTE
ncbi:hypothetical protein ES703_109551 [subsurface metagenome]